jgi:DNA polymerase III delta prime subunit
VFDSLKIVILDEADSLSSNSGTGTSAQGALRNIIEEASDDTRFIFTCNYLNKIIEPLQSRCTPIKLRFSANDVLKKCVEILKKENIKYNKETLIEFTNDVIKRKMPDMRSIINNLEQWSVSGELKNSGCSEGSELEKIVDYILKTKDVKKVRQWLIQNEDKFASDYENLAKLMFEKLFSSDDKNAGKKQLMIAEALYRMAITLDGEVMFYSLLLQLNQ